MTYDDYKYAPTWVATVSGALRWIKDAKQFEKTYRKDCTDYDGAMEVYTDMIMDCARHLDEINKKRYLRRTMKLTKMEEENE